MAPRPSFLTDIAPKLTSFICLFQEQSGKAPSLRNIAEEFDVSREMARKYLSTLERHGLARREFTNARVVRWIHFDNPEGSNERAGYDSTQPSVG